MGAGKTRAALSLAVDHWGCRKVLVICPKAVVRVWPKELAACGLTDWLAYPLDVGTGAKRAAQVELAGIAAAVAVQCGQLERAKKLACNGLTRATPPEIAQELREIIERSET